MTNTKSQDKSNNDVSIDGQKSEQKYKRTQVFEYFNQAKKGYEGEEYLLGESDSEFVVKLSELKPRSRLNRVMFLWRKAYKRAKGGAQLIHVFYNIHKQMVLYGSTKNMYGDNKRFRGKDYARNRRCLLLPESKFKTYWTVTIILLLVYTAIFVPFRVSFIVEESLGLLIMEGIVDILFGIDIFVNFISAKEEAQG